MLSSRILPLTVTFQTWMLKLCRLRTGDGDDVFSKPEVLDRSVYRFYLTHAGQANDEVWRFQGSDV
jgi:hypothetical protein